MPSDPLSRASSQNFGHARISLCHLEDIGLRGMPIGIAEYVGMIESLTLFLMLKGEKSLELSTVEVRSDEYGSYRKRHCLTIDMDSMPLGTIDLNA